MVEPLYMWIHLVLALPIPLPDLYAPPACSSRSQAPPRTLPVSPHLPDIGSYFNRLIFTYPSVLHGPSRSYSSRVPPEYTSGVFL
jgi:hypothetical protein